ncbi:MAG: gliding motility-associated C-terminal domain-containing protein, partial [Lentimicrobium sp.]|nr:gliding motility-associated C-terminal domain-containing protein [Lentimicrobium sp.]
DIIPTFDAIGPYCIGATIPELPTSSTNFIPITGTWNPAIDNTVTTEYTFTPDAGQCATTTTLTIVISSPTIINIETIPATNGQADGIATIIASGGTAPLTYSINRIDWYLTTEFTGLTIGSHTGYVRDANGCEAELAFNISNSIVGIVEMTADIIEQCINLPITLPVNSDNFTEIAAFTIKLIFDSNIINFVNLVNINPILDAAATEPFAVTVIDDTLILRYSAKPGSVTIPNNSRLFEVQFNGLAAGSTSIDWKFAECIITTAEGYAIPKILNPGEVTVLAAPDISLAAGGEFCAGDSTQFVASNNDTQRLEYLWNGPNIVNKTGSSLAFNPLRVADEGTYTLTATNIETGCPIDENVTLLVNPSPEISISETASLCAGTIHYLDAGPGFEEYFWQDGSVLQTYQASDTGTYAVKVVNSFGCAGNSSVKLIPCILEMYVPNAFTPGDDGKNDTFNPLILGDIVPTRFLMQIYNRWGQMIYSSNAYNVGWDGTYVGANAPPGVYTYLISFEIPGYIQAIADSPMRGTVTLIR